MDLYFVLDEILRYGECFFQENIPFAVVGTDKEHQVNGNKVLGRKTKWGIIEGESLKTSSAMNCWSPVIFCVLDAGVSARLLN